MSKYIDITDMGTYVDRLIAIPSNRKAFIHDYIQGDGDELASKFWNRKSSSRLCFDMWSWLTDHPSVKTLAFEYKLPAMIASNRGPADKAPNMDVFVQTEDTMLFVESKYTELAHTYYKHGGKNGLADSYWIQKNHGGVSPKNRFYGEQFIFDHFSDFVNKIQEIIDEKGLSDNVKWFDVKQETCHILGIIFKLLFAGMHNGTYKVKPDPNAMKDKKAILLNSVYPMKNDVIDAVPNDTLPGQFRIQAEKMVNGILDHYGYGIDMFSYRFMSYGTLLKKADFLGCMDFTKAKAYRYDATLSKLFEAYSWVDNNERGHKIM